MCEARRQAEAGGWRRADLLAAAVVRAPPVRSFARSGGSLWAILQKYWGRCSAALTSVTARQPGVAAVSNEL